MQLVMQMELIIYILKKGNKTFDELVTELNNGIIIDEAYGFHSGVDKKLEIYQFKLKVY